MVMRISMYIQLFLVLLLYGAYYIFSLKNIFPLVGSSNDNILVYLAVMHIFIPATLLGGIKKESFKKKSIISFFGFDDHLKRINGEKYSFDNILLIFSFGLFLSFPSSFLVYEKINTELILIICVFFMVILYFIFLILGRFMYGKGSDKNGDQGKIVKGDKSGE